MYSRHYIQVKKISTTATINKIDKRESRNRVDPSKASAELLTVPRGNRWCHPS